eukprot:NODE_2647_length_1150_cov_102.749319_g2425_i0.p1 GENE.NODE_2647_length_1150_cov_102.749319_g2425_i0~~NODE_2647_length_1150_cov_102.749319_g2425_i0.p1  ORF type:complete len:320 (+),score=52.50 NODE_2647_length_1150_cov_102.749319_g2425_i0:51-1010(+)
MTSALRSIIKKVDSCDVEVIFNGKSTNDYILIDDVYENSKISLPLFLSDEPVAGKVILKPCKRIVHQGIKIDLVGQILVTNDREERTEFTWQTKKYESEGSSFQDEKTLDFDFDCAKQYESYRGLNARVTYFLRVTVVKSVKNISHKEELWVQKVDPKHKALADNVHKKSYFKEKDFSKGVSMEVGVDDILHIEFKYDKKLFHLHERVLGQVSFKVVSLDLQLGEVSLVKREYIGVGDNQFFETETLQKYEIMDGTPIAGELVPIRLYLKSIPRLTPTYDLINNTFSVKYYMNLVLIAGDGKRYFKQQEIVVYRKPGQR